MHVWCFMDTPQLTMNLRLCYEIFSDVLQVYGCYLPLLFLHLKIIILYWTINASRRKRNHVAEIHDVYSRLISLFIESGVGKEYNYESMKLFLFEQFSVLWLLKFINSHWIENSVDVKFSIQSLQYSCMVKIIRFIRTGLLECDENLQLKSKFIIA
jgi:hypothetical protein